ASASPGADTRCGAGRRPLPGHRCSPGPHCGRRSPGSPAPGASSARSSRCWPPRRSRSTCCSPGAPRRRNRRSPLGRTPRTRWATTPRCSPGTCGRRCWPPRCSRTARPRCGAWSAWSRPRCPGCSSRSAGLRPRFRPARLPPSPPPRPAPSCSARTARAALRPSAAERARRGVRPDGGKGPEPMNDTTTKNPLHRGAGLVASLAAAGLLGLGSAPAALAHDTLLSSDPEADAELDEAPERIELTFSADIGDGGNAVALTDPSGKSHELDDPEVDGPDATVELDPLTEAGEYTVAYRMVSSDGHVVEDRFSFTLTEEAVAGAEKGAASPEEASDGEDSAGGAEQDTAAGGDASEEPVPSSDPVSLFGPVGGAVIGIALIALVAVVVLRLLRNRSGGDGGSGDAGGSGA